MMRNLLLLTALVFSVNLFAANDDCPRGDCGGEQAAPPVDEGVGNVAKCRNGAVDYPECKKCAANKKLITGRCEEPCENNAMNPPACNKCPFAQYSDVGDGRPECIPEECKQYNGFWDTSSPDGVFHCVLRSCKDGAPLLPFGRADKPNELMCTYYDKEVSGTMFACETGYYPKVVSKGEDQALKTFCGQGTKNINCIGFAMSSSLFESGSVPPIPERLKGLCKGYASDLDTDPKSMGKGIRSHTLPELFEPLGGKSAYKFGNGLDDFAKFNRWAREGKFPEGALLVAFKDGEEYPRHYGYYYGIINRIAAIDHFFGDGSMGKRVSVNRFMNPTFGHQFVPGQGYDYFEVWWPKQPPAQGAGGSSDGPGNTGGPPYYY